MRKIKIAPSLLSSDFSKFGEEVVRTEKAGADYIHWDVMDGHFVPNITFGPKAVKDARRHSNLPFDVHLMIREPDKYLEEFVKAGSDIITIHVEIESEGKDVAKILSEIRKKGKKAGLSVNPDGDIKKIERYLDRIDLLLVMTVFPGFGGQSFIEEPLQTIREAAAIREAKGLDFEIEVDGGVSPQTAPRVIAAGADVLVAGSAVYGQPDIAAAIKAIRGTSK